MVMERFDLTGKVIVVTGAARGLGKQMTLALAKAGADILRRRPAEQSRTSRPPREVRALGRRAARRHCRRARLLISATT